MLLLAVWFCCAQLSAQDVEADSVEVSQDVSGAVTISDSVSAPMSSLVLELMLQAVESDYDVIVDRIARDVIIAQRCNDFFEVNIVTGEERVLPHYDEDEEDVAQCKRQSENSEQQETDSEEPDFDDE